MSTSRDTGDWSLGSSQQPYDAAPSHGESWRAVSAAIVGNILEWYDFAIYGYVATIIAHNFFPSGDQVGALLATFATFGIGLWRARSAASSSAGWVIRGAARQPCF